MAIGIVKWKSRKSSYLELWWALPCQAGDGAKSLWWHQAKGRISSLPVAVIVSKSSVNKSCFLKHDCYAAYTRADMSSTTWHITGSHLPIKFIMYGVGVLIPAVLYWPVVCNVEGLGAALYQQGCPKEPLEEVTSQMTPRGYQCQSMTATHWFTLEALMKEWGVGRSVWFSKMYWLSFWKNVFIMDCY